ncbi:hypothetical protein V498_04915 [Pseudogymnoascus sp. VKM F-4517 (FW-2822)]|nr:hypothetical protein V498_04915 [Pseudogymnoascus sp. VKM F-4517 (FW-2822)]
MDTELHRTRRSRQRSASPKSPTRVVRDRHHYLREAEEFGAEEERRSRLTQEERMAEDGRKLQRRLEQDAAITILLQPSPPIHMRRAHCRASECFITNATPRGDSLIMGDYRIALVSYNLEYFHISCLEKMIDLPSLAPSRFKLDTDGYRWNNGWSWAWGLMLRKWFQHSGRVDLAIIAEYIDAYDTFKAEVKAFSAPHTEWQLTHLNHCTADRGSCGCPPEPEGPGSSPTLKDYKTGETKACSISDVLQHPYVARLSTNIVIQGPLSPSFLVVPEQESKDAEPDNDDCSHSG